MKFVSILDKHEVIWKDSPNADYYTDLNLRQIIDAISKGWGENVEKYYNYFPKDAESEEYRRIVYRDLCLPGVYEALCAFYNKMCERKSMVAKKNDARHELQREIWHISEVALYCSALKNMYDAIRDVPFVSEGMRDFTAAVGEYMVSPEYKDMEATAYRLKEELQDSRITLVYENGRLALSSIDPAGEVNARHSESDGESILRKLYPENGEHIISPFAYTPDLDGLEREMMRFYMHKKPKLFDTAEDFYNKYEDYACDFILLFVEEVSFYLSFLRFEKHMASEGFAFCEPEVKEDRRIEAVGLYDLALAASNVLRHQPVISNDFYYDDHELFFVLTGPNQGGKTTFARSLGQLVFFTKMGLHVPAQSANLHYFFDICTHFSVEESVETGRGKLMEELVRLAPMMEHSRGDVFVILNELFTTAANYDSCIMGGKVLDHFIGAGCHGIYVTHLTELLESRGSAVGLCAQLDENGVQSFKINRELKEYTNCAAGQVNKYHLTYEDLKERLR